MAIRRGELQYRQQFNASHLLMVGDAVMAIMKAMILVYPTINIGADLNQLKTLSLAHPARIGETDARELAIIFTERSSQPDSRKRLDG